MSPGTALSADGGPVKGKDLAASEALVNPTKGITSVNIITLCDGLDVLVILFIYVFGFLLAADVAAVFCSQV